MKFSLTVLAFLVLSFSGILLSAQDLPPDMPDAAAQPQPPRPPEPPLPSEPPEPGSVPNCAEAGVLGVLPGIVGLIQATETIKLILGIGETLVGRLLHFDVVPTLILFQR